MSKSTVPFYEATLRVTSKVVSDTPFNCVCGWQGIAVDLAISNDLSCCPKCANLDIRPDLEHFAFRVCSLYLEEFIFGSRKYQHDDC